LSNLQAGFFSILLDIEHWTLTIEECFSIPDQEMLLNGKCSMINDRGIGLHGGCIILWIFL